MPAEVALGRVHRHAARPEEHDERGEGRGEARVRAEGEAEAVAVAGVPGDGQPGDDEAEVAPRVGRLADPAGASGLAEAVAATDVRRRASPTARRRGPREREHARSPPPRARASLGDARPAPPSRPTVSPPRQRSGRSTADQIEFGQGCPRVIERVRRVDREHAHPPAPTPSPSTATGAASSSPPPSTPGTTCVTRPASSWCSTRTTRLREEDPFTDADRVPRARPASSCTGRASRSTSTGPGTRPSTGGPEDCWGLEVWRESPLPDDVSERCSPSTTPSTPRLGERLDRVAERGPFVLYDVHSYNHRRDGADEPEAPGEDNPEVNVGTGSLDRDRWGDVVDTFIDDAGGHGDGRRRDRRARERPLQGRPPRRLGARALPGPRRRPGAGVQEDLHGRVDRRARPGAHRRRSRRRSARPSTRCCARSASRGAADEPRRTSRSPTWRSTTRWPRPPAACSSSSTSPRSTPTTCGGRSSQGRVAEPAFTYRPLEVSPDVLAKALDNIDVATVEDPTLGHLLRAKHRELALQIEMLRARDTDDFSALSIELYGAASPELRTQAENILARVHRTESAGESLAAPEFLELAQAEIDHYREIDPEIDIHAEMRDDVNGVMVSGNTLLIDNDAVVQRARANALIQHEVGTHLVTQVNGAAQPVRVLGAGSGRLRRDAGGAGGPRRDRVRPAHPLPPAPARGARAHRPPHARRAPTSSRPGGRSSTTASPRAAPSRRPCAPTAPAG